MKSPKDFARVWGIRSISAGKKLKRLGAVPTKWVGKVPWYEDSEFERLTGSNADSVDHSAYISIDEILTRWDAVPKYAKDSLRKNSVPIEFKDGKTLYYDRAKFEDFFTNRLPRGRQPSSEPKKGSPARRGVRSTAEVRSLSKKGRYRIAVLSKDGSSWLVKYAGMNGLTALDKCEELMQCGFDFCVRGY